MARLAAPFFQQTNRVDAHAPVDGLAHVVDREQSDTGCGQCLHLYAGAAEAFGRHFTMHRMALGVDPEFDGNPGQRDRMTERDQFARALGGLNGRDARNADHVAFAGGTLADEVQRFRAHMYRTAGARQPPGFAFCSDVDHMGLACAVEVSKLF